MNKEEAIKWLTNEKWKNANNKYKKEWNEAFDLAIEALSAPQTDLISRADAIEAVHKYYQKRFTEESKWDADAKMLVLEDKTIAKDNMEICNIIKALPSADAVQGEWIDSGEYPWSKCNKCGYTITCYQEEESHYCPNCGARMTPHKGGDDE